MAVAVSLNPSTGLLCYSTLKQQKVHVLIKQMIDTS